MREATATAVMQRRRDGFNWRMQRFPITCSAENMTSQCVRDKKTKSGNYFSSLANTKNHGFDFMLNK